MTVTMYLVVEVVAALICKQQKPEKGREGEVKTGSESVYAQLKRNQTRPQNLNSIYVSAKINTKFSPATAKH